MHPPVERPVEIEVAQLVGQEDPPQVVFAVADTEVFAQGARVVAVVTQFAGRLHEKRGRRRFTHEVFGVDRSDEVIEQFVVRNRRSGNLVGVRAPLPEGEGVLQCAEVVDFRQRRAELVSLFAAVGFETGHQPVAAAQHLRLETLDGGAFVGRSHAAQELLVPSVLARAVDRAHIGDVAVDVAGEEGRVEHRRRAALADSRGDPLARVDRAQQLPHVVQVAGRSFGREVVPVARVGRRAEEIAVLDEDDVGVEQLRQLFTVIRTVGVFRAVTFGDEDRRPVEAGVRDDDAVRERALFGGLPVERLAQDQFVLLVEAGRF